MPSWFSNHIVCWYSPKRQGATNESIAADPRLIDLSGRKHDAILSGFDFDAANVITEDLAIKFDGADSIGNAAIGKALTDFTIIYKRESIYVPAWATSGSYLAKKGNAFIIDLIRYTRTIAYPVFSEPANNNSSSESKSAGTYIRTLQQLASYVDGTLQYITLNNPTIGTTPDTRDAELILGNTLDVVLYDFLLFDQTLAEEQIQWVIDNLIEQ